MRWTLRDEVNHVVDFVVGFWWATAAAILAAAPLALIALVVWLVLR
jgi:hypothetical protein